MTDLNKFLIALHDALNNNEGSFTCPICGGKVTINKAANKHVHAQCDCCGACLHQ